MAINKKKRLIVVSGKSSSGKDTITNLAMTTDVYFDNCFHIELKPIVSYSTRPPRDSEVNGREHYFISDKEADELLETKDVIAYTKIGNYRYFVTEECIEKGNIYIIDPEGIENLETNHPEYDLYKTYIKTSLPKRIWRARKRSDFKTAYFKRVRSEHKQFKKYEDEKGYDVLFNNSKYEDIYRIEQLYTIWCSFLENGVKWRGKL